MFLELSSAADRNRERAFARRPLDPARAKELLRESRAERPTHVLSPVRPVVALLTQQNHTAFLQIPHVDSACAQSVQLVWSQLVLQTVVDEDATRDQGFGQSHSELAGKVVVTGSSQR